MTGRVFEPVGLMKRDLEVNAQLGVYRLPDYPSILPVYFVVARRRCRVSQADLQVAGQHPVVGSGGVNTL